MSLPAAPKVPPQVAEQAVRWLVELQGGADDERLRQAWQRWRQAAPEHEQAWRHIEAVNQRLAGIGTPLALAAINAPHSPQRRRALNPAAGPGRRRRAWGLREAAACSAGAPTMPPASANAGAWPWPTAVASS